jgi:hypothetical protein
LSAGGRVAARVNHSRSPANLAAARGMKNGLIFNDNFLARDLLFIG